MAKRAAPDEKPYRPLLDTELLSAVIANVEPEPSQAVIASRLSSPAAKIVEMPLAESLQNDRSLAARDSLFPGHVTGRANNPIPAHVRDLALKVDSEKRILFTRHEVQSLDRMVASLAMQLQCQVKVSHVVRALVALLLHAEASVDRRAGESGPLVRPPNGDAQAIQAFERDIAKIIAAALRDAGPIP